MKLVRLVLVLVMLATPLSGEAQTSGKVHRVGLIATTTPVAQILSDSNHAFNSGLRRELRERGYVEGRNFILELRSLEGRPERAPEVVAELVRLKVDAIVTVGNPMARDAKRVTTTVPIVMGTSRSPVENGLVASLARPGGNVTGLTIDTGPEIDGKRLELLKQALPGVSRVAFIGTREDWEDARGQSARAAARALGLTLLLADHGPNDYSGAFGSIARERPQAIITSIRPDHFTYRRLIAEFAAKNRLAGMYYSREFVEAGGLMAYGADLRDLLRRAAIYVDRILKGAKPGDLPIEQPAKFELVINLKTARALGLAIPHWFILGADEVIQ